MRIPRWLLAASVVLPLALAACSSSPHSAAPAATPTHTAAASVMQLTAAQMRQECAALDLVRTGVGTYAQQVQVMAGQYAVDQHAAATLIAQAVHRSCPGEISVLP